MESKKQPVYLNLTEISLPVTGLVSILHRITGVVMLLTLPLWLWILSGFVWNHWGQTVFRLVSDWFILQLALYLAVCAWWYHIIAGFRHIYHDLNGNHSLSTMRVTAVLVLVLVIFCMFIFGWGFWR